jgi:hypothetical protein
MAAAILTVAALLIILAVITALRTSYEDTSQGEESPDGSIGAQAAAGSREDTGDAFVEIWQTMDDGRVCSACERNTGLTRADLQQPFAITFEGKTIQLPRQQEIPALCVQETGAEPGSKAWTECRCYWRLVPRSFYELMKRDRAAARRLDSCIDDRIVVRAEDGTALADVEVRPDQNEAGNA